MSEEKTTIGNFKDFTSLLESVTKRASELLESIRQDAEEIDILNDTIDELRSDIQQDAEEITKLNSIIDELRDENERLKREAKGGEA